MSVMEALELVFFSGEGRKRRTCEPDEHGIFSVKFFCAVLIRKVRLRRLLLQYGRPVLCFKSTFGWMDGIDKIQMVDHLRTRGMLIVNACPLCLKADETVNRLFIHCPFSYQIWSIFFSFWISHFVSLLIGVRC